MILPHTLLSVIFIPLALAIWLIPKAWRTKLIPNYVSYLWTLWFSSAQGLSWIILTCTTSFMSSFIPYLVRKETVAITNYIYMHGAENVLSKITYLMILFVLTDVLYFVQKSLSVRLKHFWEERLCGDVFRYLLDLSAHRPDRFLATNDDDDNESTEDCESEHIQDCSTHESMDNHDTDHPLINGEEYVEKALDLSERLDEMFHKAIPSCLQLLMNTVLLGEIIGIGPAILIMSFGYLNVVLFDYLRGHVFPSKLVDTMRRTKGDFEQVVNESVRNWITVHSFNQSEQEKARFRDTHEKYAAADQRYTDSFMTFQFLQEGLLRLLQYATVFFAVGRFSQTIISVGELVLLLDLWDTLLRPLSTILDQFSELRSFRKTAQEISTLLQNTISDDSSIPLVADKGRVVFENVSFSYGDSTPVLREISLTAEPGTTVALVGGPGSGKSTILKLLLRLHDVTAGSISIDGQDLRNVSLRSLRDSQGTVSQQTQLFSRTIRENLKYGRPNATDDEMRAACQTVDIHETIQGLPNGYSTILEDCGNSEQLDDDVFERISMARTIIKNPKLFVFDEPASSVDYTTMASLHHVFRDVCSGHTTFIATRRLLIVTAADRIVFMDEGQIAEEGTHDVLMALGGKYCKMWKAQDDEYYRGMEKEFNEKYSSF